ncbi:hypothetical protein J7M07_05275 [bacterium]|nr:hypothetical protein [bacterium]
MKLFRKYGKTQKIIDILVVIFIFSSLSASSAPQQTGDWIDSNFQLLNNLSIEAIDEILANMPSIEKEKRVVLVKGRGLGEIDFVFENALLQQTNNAGMSVSRKTDIADSTETVQTGYELNYQVLEMSLTYPEISRSWWIGAKEVERNARIHLFVQLVDIKSGDIIWIGETEKTFNDVIPYSFLDKVEDETYSFTKPERSEFSLSKLIQPVIVTGIVSGLVYLFFSNQSNE